MFKQQAILIHTILVSVMVSVVVIASESAHAASETSYDNNLSPFSSLQEVFAQDWTSSELNQFALQPKALVNLIEYLRSNVSGNRRIPDYDRTTDFGSWAYPNPTLCKNTRALVLLREADPSVAIKYTNAGECSVLTGLWHDTYTGADVKKARDLDIDHVVPLHNAWESGAYKWDFTRRCHYSNFMQNAIHLRAVSSTQNRMKGDRGPDGYMPEYTSNACEYLSSWMKIKTIWELSSTPSELAAIETLFKQNHCKVSDAHFSACDLLDQRKVSAEPIKACVEYFSQPTQFPTKNDD